MLCLSLLGPQPLGWLWVGSQVEYQTGAVTAGIATIMLGTLASLMLTMVLAKRVDYWWKLARRAGGHHQERGALERIFVLAIGVALVVFGVLVLHRPGAGTVARAHELVGLLDYYKQFEDVDEEQLNVERRERRRREKELALQRVETIDLSSTEWPEFPNSEVDERLDLHRARARERLSRPPRDEACAACWRSATGSSPSRSCSATARPSCCRRRR